MRISGGKARGILLDVPQDQEFLRPATDYLREAVFSHIARDIENKTVLDLFAGVGTYGLEAASRGAVCSVFVEKNKTAALAIHTNIKRVEKSMKRVFNSKVITQDVFEFDPCDSQFDFIFIDPPYNMLETKSSEIIAKFLPVLANTREARIILEVPASFDLEPNELLFEVKRLGRKGKSRQPNVIVLARKM